MKRLTQKDRIVKILENEGEVSNVKCFTGSYGFISLRLGDIIFRLRKEGWEISTSMEGPNHNQAIYRLVKDPRKVSVYRTKELGIVALDRTY